jgi:hypothetical protein
MILTNAFPPYMQGILSEPKRLNKRAAKPETPDLVDGEASQSRIISIQESAIR